MKKVKRFDLFNCDNVEMLSTGFLRVPVFAARTGIQVYRKADGSSLKEFRPAEEVFSKDAMSTLRSCPITDDHPSEMVTMDNVKELMVGHTSDVVRNEDNKFLATDAIITDKAVIDKIKTGKVQVSMGYEVDLEENPGEFNGQRYDMIQRNIRHNHLAIVDRGRAGPEVRLRLDGDDAVSVDDKQTKEDQMGKLTINEKEFDVPTDLAKEVNGLIKANAKLEKAAKKDEDDGSEALEAIEAKLDAADAKIDALEADKKKAEKAAKEKTDTADFDTKVKARVALEKTAEKLKVDTTDKTDRELKEEIIKTDSPDFEGEEKSDAYVDARFDMVVESLGKSDKANEKAGDAISGARKSEKKDGEPKEDAETKYSKELDNAWKQPVGRTSTMKYAQAAGE